MDTPVIPRDQEMLGELAECDLALAKHVFACCRATEDPGEVANLARAYQRVARSCRQTILAKAKLEKERAEARARAAELAQRRAPIVHVPDARERLIDGRIEDLQDAIGRIAAAAHPTNLKLQREALDRLDVELEEWPDDEDFLLERLTTLVDQACERLGLPRRYADTWEDLPKPPNPFDPATKAAAPSAPPLADTG